MLRATPRALLSRALLPSECCKVWAAPVAGAVRGVELASALPLLRLQCGCMIAQGTTSVHRALAE